MSETVAVGTPGSGPTVIETGVNDGVAKPAPQYVSDTAGMSASQSAALQFVDANRAEVMKASNPFLQRKYNQALAHAFEGAAAPEWIAANEQARADAAKNDHRPIAEGINDVQMGAELDPIQAGDVEKLVNRGVVQGQLPREVATEAAQMCLTAQLPPVVANALMDRLSRHAAEGYGLGTLSKEDQQELVEECAKLYGGYEKAQAEATLARKYLHSVGGQKMLDFVDKRGGSLAFDPRVINQLTYMARLKGLA
jgi:hypothetical protein